jgi:hypothetical protein
MPGVFGGLTNASLRGELRDRLGAPTLAFLGATLLLYTGYLASGVSLHFLAGANWAHYDSFIYESITQRGYYIFACPPHTPPGLCGDGGWFPGYPLMLWPFFELWPGHLNLEGELVSWAFDYGLLVLLWSELRKLDGNLRYVALVFAACVPGGVLMRSVFPMSMTAFFLVGGILAARAERWKLAGVLTGIAGSCYITAAAFAPVLVVIAFWRMRDRPMFVRVREAGLAGAFALGGFIADCIVLQAETGHWNLYFRVQDIYLHGFHGPWATIWPVIKGVLGHYYVHTLSAEYPAQSTAVGVEAAVAVIIVCCVVGGLIWRLRQHIATDWDIALTVLIVILWFLPVTQANLSWWRDDTLLVPAALLIPRMPKSIGVTVTVLAVAMFPLLTAYFVQNNLV